jgi:hypothetical protein
VTFLIHSAEVAVGVAVAWVIIVCFFESTNSINRIWQKIWHRRVK